MYEALVEIVVIETLRHFLAERQWINALLNKNSSYITSLP